VKRHSVEEIDRAHLHRIGRYFALLSANYPLTPCWLSLWQSRCRWSFNELNRPCSVTGGCTQPGVHVH